MIERETFTDVKDKLPYDRAELLRRTTRRIAAGRLGGVGSGLDAARALDAIAGGYLHNIPSLRDPVQRTIGSLWRTRSRLIQPGKRHKLVPVFTE